MDILGQKRAHGDHFVGPACSMLLRFCWGSKQTSSSSKMAHSERAEHLVHPMVRVLTTVPQGHHFFDIAIKKFMMWLQQKLHTTLLGHTFNTWILSIYLRVRTCIFVGYKSRRRRTPEVHGCPAVCPWIACLQYCRRGTVLMVFQAGPLLFNSYPLFTPLWLLSLTQRPCQCRPNNTIQCCINSVTKDQMKTEHYKLSGFNELRLKPIDKMNPHLMIMPSWWKLVQVGKSNRRGLLVYQLFVSYNIRNQIQKHQTVQL